MFLKNFPSSFVPFASNLHQRKHLDGIDALLKLYLHSFSFLDKEVTETPEDTVTPGRSDALQEGMTEEFQPVCSHNYASMQIAIYS